MKSEQQTCHTVTVDMVPQARGGVALIQRRKNMKKPTPFKSENLYSGVRVHESEQEKPLGPVH